MSHLVWGGKTGTPVSGVEIKVLLISFVWAVGLTRVLESFGALWVARKRVRFAGSQLLWMVAILVDILGNWLAVAPAPASQAPPGVFLGILVYSLGLFFAATVVSPRIPKKAFSISPTTKPGKVPAIRLPSSS
jgi:hypothetical protein